MSSSSFYDLTKDFVLSAQDLFKWRGKRTKTLPSKGGQKDFEPDESWMQNKALEAFLQERTSILAEPRVEKLRNLVEGTWDREKRLVNVKKTGKFWAHMGFTDQRRNWLYPEEALFLMECNTLEVTYAGVPLSIQEAYSMFLGHDLTIEEYQVFSHLRRLGFVVLRHENQPHVTAYEKQINLDQYISKKKRKERADQARNKKDTSVLSGAATTDDKPSTESGQLPGQSLEPADISRGHLQVETTAEEKNSEIGSSVTVAKLSSNQGNNPVQETDLTPDCSSKGQLSQVNPRKRSASPSEESNVGIKKCQESAHNMDSSDHCIQLNGTGEEKQQNLQENKVGAHPPVTLNRDSDTERARGFYDLSWDSCFILGGKLGDSSSMNIPETTAGCPSYDRTDEVDMIQDSETKQPTSEDRLVGLPNIANADRLVLEPPTPRLLPDCCTISQSPHLLSFDVKQYRLQNPALALKRQEQREEATERHKQGLEFSCPIWARSQDRLSANSWAEYKKKLADRKKDVLKSAAVQHLWAGKVTPLLEPGLDLSYQMILDKLNIIKAADNETLVPRSDCMPVVKVVYDIHLPDGQFKKSMPGVPNHRVCVTKCSSNPPGLAEVQQVWSQLKDNVPIHWAVVDSGDIAFFKFDNNHSFVSE